MHRFSRLLSRRVQRTTHIASTVVCRSAMPPVMGPHLVVIAAARHCSSSNGTTVSTPLSSGAVANDNSSSGRLGDEEEDTVETLDAGTSAALASIARGLSVTDDDAVSRDPLSTSATNSDKRSADASEDDAEDSPSPSSESGPVSGGALDWSGALDEALETSNMLDFDDDVADEGTTTATSASPLRVTVGPGEDADDDSGLDDPAASERRAALQGAFSTLAVHLDDDFPDDVAVVAPTDPVPDGPRVSDEELLDAALATLTDNTAKSSAYSGDASFFTSPSGGPTSDRHHAQSGAHPDSANPTMPPSLADLGDAVPSKMNMQHVGGMRPPICPSDDSRFYTPFRVPRRPLCRGIVVAWFAERGFGLVVDEEDLLAQQEYEQSDAVRDLTRSMAGSEGLSLRPKVDEGHKHVYDCYFVTGNSIRFSARTHLPKAFHTAHVFSRVEFDKSPPSAKMRVAMNVCAPGGLTMPPGPEVDDASVGDGEGEDGTATSAASDSTLFGGHSLVEHDAIGATALGAAVKHAAPPKATFRDDFYTVSREERDALQFGMASASASSVKKRANSPASTITNPDLFQFELEGGGSKSDPASKPSDNAPTSSNGGGSGGSQGDKRPLSMTASGTRRSTESKKTIRMIDKTSRKGSTAPRSLLSPITKTKV